MYCDSGVPHSDARRRASVRSDIQGIDYVDVLDVAAPTEDMRWRIVLAYCLNGAEGLIGENFQINSATGGNGLTVEWAHPADSLLIPAAGEPSDAQSDTSSVPRFELPLFYDQAGNSRTLTVEELEYFAGLSNSERLVVMHVRHVTPPEDNAITYTMTMVTTTVDSDSELDPRLASYPFVLHAEGSVELDCAPSQSLATTASTSPPIDYLARDYASLRRLLLDRMAVVMPDWNERTPADIGITLIEILSYIGDHLSYYQDAVATEAYLGTARRRISVRRHARLLDYNLHQGNNARMWICFTVSGTGSDTDGDTDSDTYGNTGSDTDGDTDDDMDIDKSSGTVTIPAGTRLLTRLVNEDRVVLSEAAVGSAILQGAEFFETIHAIEAKPGYGMIQLYDWGGAVERLSRGATRATLELNETDIDDVKIVSGSVLLLEEIDDEDTGQPADPTHRHAVCVTAVKKVSDALRCDPGTDSSLFEVSWAENDALPFSLPLRHPSGKPAAVACGNVAIADYGRTVAMEPLVPEFVQPGERYRPRLRVGNVTHRVSLDETLRAQDTSGQLVQDPARALPVITVLELPEGSRSSEDSSNESQAVPWYPRGDLLASGPFDRHFALEVESDGTARLRFGDGVYGRLPGTESQWYATYRVGTGRAGNVGAGAIAHVIPVNGDESNQTDSLTIIGVRNPLPATGGQEPERDEQARLYAPYAFRFAQRAVTAEDYAEITERHPEVQKAVAEIRWSGSWNTVFITVDRRGGLPLDREFEAELRAFLEPFRMAGQDLEFIPPRFVALDIAFTVHVAPEHLRSEVEVVLLAALGNGETSAGKLGFFHPDNFTFGDPVYLSDLVAAAMEVPGVVWLDVDDRPPKENRFRRFGESSRGEVGAGQITVGSAEIIRVDNDPTAPYNGRLQLFMEGGL